VIIYHKIETIAISQNSVSIHGGKVSFKKERKMSTVEEKEKLIKQLEITKREIQQNIYRLRGEITEEIQKNCEHKWEWMWRNEEFWYVPVIHCGECDKFAERAEYPELYIDAPKKTQSVPVPW
jgi:hypothetical protein